MGSSIRVDPARQRQKPNWAKPEMAWKIALPSLSSTPEVSAQARRKSSRSASMAVLLQMSKNWRHWGEFSSEPSEAAPADVAMTPDAASVAAAVVAKAASRDRGEAPRQPA